MLFKPCGAVINISGCRIPVGSQAGTHHHHISVDKVLFFHLFSCKDQSLDLAHILGLIYGSWGRLIAVKVPLHEMTFEVFDQQMKLLTFGRVIISME
jgi:hypothetical protein